MFEGPDMFPDGGGKVLGLDEAFGTQELFVTSGPIAGIIKKIYG